MSVASEMNEMLAAVSQDTVAVTFRITLPHGAKRLWMNDDGSVAYECTMTAKRVDMYAVHNAIADSDHISEQMRKSLHRAVDRVVQCKMFKLVAEKYIEIIPD